VLGSVQGFKVI